MWSQFVYLKSAFTPSLDDEVQSLFEARACAHAAAPRRLPHASHVSPLFKGFVVCIRVSMASLTRHASARLQAFGEEGKLVLHYASTPAWG
jgi:hypothetical protein